MGSVYLALLSGYTMSALARMGNRPQGYLLLARDLGRSGYLAGLYLASLLVVLGTYLLFSALMHVIWLSRPATLTFGDWLVGSVPLLLNSGILMAFVALITPLVLTTWPRLLVLGLVVLALGRDVDIFGHLPGHSLLKPIETLLGLPLLPLFAGYALATSPGVTLLERGVVALEQLLLLIVLLVVALLAFERRELILAS